MKRIYIAVFVIILHMLDKTTAIKVDIEIVSSRLIDASHTPHRQLNSRQVSNGKYQLYHL